MVKKRTDPIWITYIGDHENPQKTEYHEDEYRADLRILLDPERRKTSVAPKLATFLADWIRVKALNTEFYTEENVEEVIEKTEALGLARPLDRENDLIWLTARLAKGREEEGIISRPAYWQLHKNKEEAIKAKESRDRVSKLVGDNYQHEILFKVEDLRGLIQRSNGPRNITQPLGAPKRPLEEKQRHSYAGNLTKPLLERYREYEEDHPEWTDSECQRYLIFKGMEAAEKRGELIHLPVLHEEGLNMKDLSKMLRLRVNDKDKARIDGFMKRFRSTKKQDFICRAVYEGLLAEGYRQPRGFPQDS